MTSITTKPPRRSGRIAPFAKAAAVSLLALTAAGCRDTVTGPQVAGWTLVDPSERHPILVSQQPKHLNIRVARGSLGLSPAQRAEVLEFAGRWRATDAGNSRLIIAAPSGSANEVASMHAVQDIRGLLDDNGFQESSITVEAYYEERDPQPPVRISYLRYVAEGPECGTWPANLAEQRDNANYANFGCATQRNLAAQIANPADLLGPRNETARSSERRGDTWERYVKGEPTGARKSQDEKTNTKAQN